MVKSETRRDAETLVRNPSLKKSKNKPCKNETSRLIENASEISRSTFFEVPFATPKMQVEHNLQSRNCTRLSQNIPQKNVNDHLLDICFHKSIPFFPVACSRPADSRRPETGYLLQKVVDLEVFIRPRDLTLHISLHVTMNQGTTNIYAQIKAADQNIVQKE